ncbi:MAG: molybdenum cofactor guanylyltransferase [Chromatocurvus sp.]
MHPATHSSIDPIATQLRERTTGLVLAGGAGRRMQSRDKGLVSWQGEPLVAHAARSLRPLVSRLLISCNRNLDRYRNFADHVVTDMRSGCEGPLAGLEAAGRELNTPLLLVSPCDMPGVSQAVFALLRDTITIQPEKRPDAVYLFSSGREHYLCLALRREALAGITDYLDSGRRSVKGWLSTLDTRTMCIDLPQQALRNINQIYTGD